MRIAIALAVSVVACTPAFAQKTPTFKPAEVKRECTRYVANAAALNDAQVTLQLLKVSLERTNLAIQAKDYRRARALKAETLAPMRTLIDRIDAMVESQIYLTQLQDHLRRLSHEESERLRPALAACLAAGADDEPAAEVGDSGGNSVGDAVQDPDDPLSGGVVD
ncbi:hypothetical protein [Myxococcus virescens]|nr:hypothetical protein [Myxococcus virescens]SDD65444.1 hypothetical protein SAMN04488504_102141 [Myxococcus virescens]